MIGKVLLRWLIVLMAIIAIAITILLTPAGLRIGLHVANIVLPGKIRYEHASGVITGPIEIRNFKYIDDTATLSIHKLKFSWNPWLLFHRKIDITLRINNII